MSSSVSSQKEAALKGRTRSDSLSGSPASPRMGQVAKEMRERKRKKQLMYTIGSLLVCHIQRPSRFSLIFWFTWCPSLSVFHLVLQPSFPGVLHKTFFDSAAGHHHSPTPSTALRICNFYLMLAMLFCGCRFFSQPHSSLLGGRVKPSVFLSPCPPSTMSPGLVGTGGAQYIRNHSPPTTTCIASSTGLHVWGLTLFWDGFLDFRSPWACLCTG